MRWRTALPRHLRKYQFGVWAACADTPRDFRITDAVVGEPLCRSNDGEAVVIVSEQLHRTGQMRGDDDRDLEPPISGEVRNTNRGKPAVLPPDKRRLRDASGRAIDRKPRTFGLMAFNHDHFGLAITIQIRSDDLVEEDESLTIRLLDDPGGEYVVSPRSEATVVVGSDDLPELTLTGGGLIAEGETAFVTVVADQAPTTDTSVNYSVSGSARAGVDFEVLMGTALLRAGEVSIEIPIRSINDDVVFQPGDMVVAEWPARVGTVSVEEGQFVMRGTPVLTLTEPVFTIKLFASPSNRAKLEVGQEVTVNLDAGDQEVAGVIVELADSVTTGGASETYEGVVDTSEALVGVDGAVVTIDVVVAQVVDAVVVPIAAVLTDGGEQKVRVVTRAGVIERRIVETGMLDGAYVEIVSGVSHGEYVILEIDRS